MFNRYWRTYPWVLQMALMFLTMFTLFSFGTYLILLLVPKFSGFSFNELVQLTSKSSPKAIRAGIMAQAISHATTFAVPGLIFAIFTHPRVRSYLGLRTPGKAIHWPLVTGMMLGIIPVFLWGETWSTQHLHFGKWAEELQESNNNMIGAFLRLRSGGDFVLLMAILALLPAVGEEIIFRGVLLRLIHRRSSRPLFLSNNDIPRPLPDAQQSMVFPVIFTAFLFASIHFNPHGFVFIFAAGCILALVYFLTSSLLCSMWAHFLYNGLQVAAAFFSGGTEAMQKAAASENLPVVYPLAGLLLFGVSFYLLVRNQTPLLADWSDDFKGEIPDLPEEPSNIFK